jgi:hypothetical protein
VGTSGPALPTVHPISNVVSNSTTLPPPPRPLRLTHLISSPILERPTSLTRSSHGVPHPPDGWSKSTTDRPDISRAAPTRARQQDAVPNLTSLDLTSHLFLAVLTDNRCISACTEHNSRRCCSTPGFQASRSSHRG